MNKLHLPNDTLLIISEPLWPPSVSYVEGLAYIDYKSPISKVDFVHLLPFEKIEFIKKLLWTWDCYPEMVESQLKQNWFEFSQSLLSQKNISIGDVCNPITFWIDIGEGHTIETLKQEISVDSLLLIYNSLTDENISLENLRSYGKEVDLSDYFFILLNSASLKNADSIADEIFATLNPLLNAMDKEST